MQGARYGWIPNSFMSLKTQFSPVQEVWATGQNYMNRHNWFSALNLCNIFYFGSLFGATLRCAQGLFLTLHGENYSFLAVNIKTTFSTGDQTWFCPMQGKCPNHYTIILSPDISKFNSLVLIPWNTDWKFPLFKPLYMLKLANLFGLSFFDSLIISKSPLC